MSLLHWRTKQQEGEPTEPSPLSGLRHEIDKLLDAYVREPFGAVEWPFGSQGKWLPSVEIAESDDAVFLWAEIPGVNPDKIDVTVGGGRLVIAGEKPQPSRPEASEVGRTEIRYGAFRRSIPLPEEVDIEKIDAAYQHGVLSLRLPKQQPAGAQKVHIKVAG
jgi:HSP20 family protein